MAYRDKYENKVYVINTFPELESWLRGRLESAGAEVSPRITSSVDGVIQPRDNLVKKTQTTIRKTYDFDYQRAKRGIDRVKLEIVASDLIDNDFRPVWVCNDPSCLKYRNTCQVVMPDDIGYEMSYDDLVNDAKSMGMFRVQRWSFGTKYIVVPKFLTAQNIQWFKQMLRKVGDENNLFMIREDKFHEQAVKEREEKNQAVGQGWDRPAFSSAGSDRKQKNLVYSTSTFTPAKEKAVWGSHVKRSYDVFPDEYVIIDTEHNTFHKRPGEELITEVGLIHIKDDVIKDTYTTLIRNDGVDLREQPKYKALTDKDLAGARTVQEVEPILKSKIGELPVVGYGIEQDLNLLNQHFETPKDMVYVELRNLAKRYLPTEQLADASMASIINMLGMEPQQHRALPDCISTQHVYSEIKDRAYC